MNAKIGVSIIQIAMGGVKTGGKNMAIGVAAIGGTVVWLPSKIAYFDNTWVQLGSTLPRYYPNSAPSAPRNQSPLPKSKSSVKTLDFKSEGGKVEEGGGEFGVPKVEVRVQVARNP